MKIFIHTTFILMLLFAGSSFSQSVKLVKGFGMHQVNGGVNSLQTDNNGNYIIAGYGDSVIHFGADSFVNKSGGFIASLDSLGKLNWAKACGSYHTGAAYYRAKSDVPLAICDSHNRLFACGNFDSISHVGDSTLVQPGISNTFLARFKTDGTIQWVRKVAHGFLLTGFNEDRFGNLVVTGSKNTLDSCTFGNTKILLDIVIAKFDSNGTLLWAKDAGTSSYMYEDRGYSASTDYAGNIYIGGIYRNNILFDNIHLNLDANNQNQAGWQGFVAKYSPTGVALWAKECGYECVTVAADSAGNLYAGGYTYRYNYFDTTLPQGHFSAGIWFVAKYNALGKLSWNRLDTTETSSDLIALVTDVYGNCYATGKCGRYFKLGAFMTDSTNATTNQNAFLVALNPNGSPLWAKCSKNSTAFGYAISTSKCHIAYTGVYLRSSFNFDMTTIPISPQDTGAITKINFFLVAMDTCEQRLQTGIEPIEDNTFHCSLYPNPSTGTFTLQSEGLIHQSYTIYDLLGQAIASDIITINNQTIQLEGLADGVYILEIKGTDRRLKFCIARE